MATLTVQTITRAGVTVALVPAGTTSAGDEFVNDGRTFLEVNNAHASASRTVTIVSRVTSPPPGTAAANVLVNVNPNTRVKIGPFPTQAFNDANSRAKVTYSNNGADLTVAVYKLE
jgi:hypothetical protein